MSVSLLLLLSLAGMARCLPEAGRWTLTYDGSGYEGVTKNVFSKTEVFVRIVCSAKTENVNVKIGWMIRETQCWNEYAYLEGERSIFQTYYDDPLVAVSIPGFNASAVHYERFNEKSYPCGSAPIDLDPSKQLLEAMSKTNSSSSSTSSSGSLGSHQSPVHVISHSGDYLLVLHVYAPDDSAFTATADVQLRGPRGFLSLSDWPLLPFYGCMCAVYVVMALVWLVLCARHWRDLLRIQYWIGGVILLGMLEKAMFIAEYENVNQNGSLTSGLIVAAEFVSCAKRALARMLVVIVSLGFGIVKPRLGPTLHRVVAIGGLYFVLASTEAYLRVTRKKGDVSAFAMFAGIPLAVIDSSICWWVFSALVQTTRTLRLRRNVVKLALYKHFTNTLIFSVIASVIFMLWSIKYHKLGSCLLQWRDLWVDDAFWPLLFSIILITIMFLWRPSQNNQRYAFTPLLDSEEDEASEDDDDPFYHGKVTMRSVGKGPKDATKDTQGADPDDDPMKWIEENIPEAGDNPLPVIDSEEEIETTKLEINKMQ